MRSRLKDGGSSLAALPIFCFNFQWHVHSGQICWVHVLISNLVLMSPPINHQPHQQHQTRNLVPASSPEPIASNLSKLATHSQHPQQEFAFMMGESNLDDYDSRKYRCRPFDGTPGRPFELFYPLPKLAPRRVPAVPTVWATTDNGTSSSVNT